MKAIRLLLAGLALGGAALLHGPAQGYTLLGTELGLDQRDFRVYNNFTDVTANDNQTPDSQFPGHQGAVMAIWKACVEWGSELHGNGGGDPFQPGTLGSGGANFDPAFAGEADGVGGSSANIHSEISGSDPGVYAYCEGPANDGWRIRYWSNWLWSDGPTTASGSLKDLQGIATHEYGHAIGLDHSANPSATMKPGTFAGNEQRDIHSDDIAGIQFIYGVKSASKPRVTNATLVGTTLTVTGTGFSAMDNEVWFTSQLVTSAAVADPLVKATGIASPSGTSMTLTIPDLAGQGDILVKNAGTGHTALSNARPFSGEGPGPTGPTISGISPSTVNAVNVGTGQIVTIFGNDFTPSSSILVNGQALFGIPSPYTVVDSNTITFDPPQPASLGSVTIEVVNEFGSDTTTLNYVANPTPALQVGTGDEPVTFIGSVNVVVGGTPGGLFFLGFSLSAIPSVLPGVVSLEIGNGFTSIFQVGGAIAIPAKGWTEFTVPGAGLPPLTTFFLEGVLFEPIPVLPIPDSNKQEVDFLF